ncbi:leucine efflux protein LeuE [Nonomuraea soli]|uniref:Leucine efflux protein n=1 Tax=Nonomuraea soli TaxID=1032476 RepID=A0A7W0HRU1_9ACTN|nr:leucine efflux protein LeuE [Nonomuraea soli]MBA2893363.1 leucine efflux protein [Nonomuraea soli]
MFFGVTNIWAYVLAALLIVLLPGPNSIYVLTTAAQRGVREGYRAAAGVFVGDTVLMLAAALGAASLLQSSPLLFTIVKYAGAAYLGWIGFQMIRGAWRRDKTEERVQVAADPSPFRKALVISLLNPKAILFIVSVFVQFVDTSYATPAVPFLILGVILQLFSVLYLSTLIFGGTFLASQFRSRRRLSATLTSGIGVLFLGFGAKLATASLG